MVPSSGSSARTLETQGDEFTRPNSVDEATMVPTCPPPVPSIFLCNVCSLYRLIIRVRFHFIPSSWFRPLLQAVIDFLIKRKAQRFGIEFVAVPLLNVAVFLSIFFLFSHIPKQDTPG